MKIEIYKNARRHRELAKRSHEASKRLDRETASFLAVTVAFLLFIIPRGHVIL